jgi:hypothetical protein
VTPSDGSKSGSTIASIVFTNRNSTEKRTSEDTFQMSLTDMQDLNSQANYEYYLRYSGEQRTGDRREDTLGYSDTFEAPELTAYRPADTLGYSDTFESTDLPRHSTDDRQIKAAGYYDLSTIAEEPSVSAYSDQQELDQVVDLYKSQIERTISCAEEVVSSPTVPSDRVINTDKRSAIRKKCVDQMGEEVFQEIYEFLKMARKRDVPDDVISEQAVKRWGKAANRHCLLVDQLIFIER